MPILNHEWNELLERLQRNDPTLTSINIENTKILDSGFKRLREALKNNRTLTSLVLKDNQMGNSGAKELSLALKDNRTLTSLNFENNQIGDNGAKELSLALKDNRTLMSLNFGANQIEASGAKALSLALKDNDTLTSLDLGVNQIGDSGAKELSLALKDNHTLTSLNLNRNQIGDSGAKELSLALKDNNTLISLNLEWNQIEASGAKDLSLALKGNRTLTFLNLKANQIGASGAKDLSLVLKDNHALTSLDLGVNQIGDSGAKDLGLALKDNRTLTSLNLSHNQIGGSGAKDLSLALKDNRTLTSLNLSHNKIGNSGAKDLSLILKDNHTLTSLNLNSNQIGDSGAKDLSLALKDNRILTSLSLEDNQIGDSGAKELSLALKDNHTLTSLNLSKNQIGDSGAKELSLALKDNHTLTSLDLSENQIGDSGAKDLSLALKDNHALTSLSLWSNQIGDSGAKELSLALKDNYTLTSTNLWANKIGSSAVKEIEQLISRNGQLRDQLHTAVRQGKLSLAQQLASQGVSLISTTQAKDNTPLHEAIINGHFALTQWLIETLQAQGLPLTLKNKDNKIAQDLAQSQPALAALFSQVSPAVTASPTLPPGKTNEVEIGVFSPRVTPAAITAAQFARVPVKGAVPSPSSPVLTLPTTLQTIAWKDIQLDGLIGHGGFGEVYKAMWHGTPVAVKKLHLKTMTSDLMQGFQDEATLMARLHFPNVVHLFGVSLDVGHYAMVMEYLPKGSLYHVLQDKNIKLPWQPLRWQIAIDIGQGLSYLHGQQIVHQDLKSLNVLLDKDYRAKIGDFGLSKIKLETNSTTTQSAAPKGGGSTRWRAPELFKRGGKPNAASDVYSYGMVLWEIASRQLPFSDALDDVTVMGWIKDGETEVLPTDCPQPYSQLVQACWSAPTARPSAAEAVRTLQQAYATLSAVIMTPSAKSWHFATDLKASSANTTSGYQLLPAAPSDMDKVLQHYKHHPVPGMDIKTVQVIYNPTMNRSFALRMQLLQERQGNPAFAPKWEKESQTAEEKAWRQAIANQWQTLAHPYTDSDYPAVKLLPLWHGTNPTILESLFKTGFANLASTDSGYFGKGIYGAYEAEYSHRVYSKGALIMNWVASFSAYPVMDGDMSKLMEKGNYQNYDAHFIPAIPPDGKFSEKASVYYPCKPNQKHQYTEVVVFESAQCLPRYLVELQPSLPKAPASTFFKPANNEPPKKQPAANEPAAPKTAFKLS